MKQEIVSMNIQKAIRKAVMEFGDSIIIEKRLINILNDYGAFRENRALRAVLVDMLAVKLYVPLLTTSVDDMVKRGFRQSLSINFRKTYPYQEDVVNDIVEIVIGSFVVEKDERSIDYWLHVLKAKYPKVFKDITSNKNKVNIFKFQKKLNDFGFMDLDGNVIVPYGKLGKDTMYTVAYTDFHPFFDKWKIRDVFQLFFFSNICICRKDQVGNVLNGRILNCAQRLKENDSYQWYYNYLCEQDRLHEENTFAYRLKQCKEKNLKVLGKCFPHKKAENILEKDVCDSLMKCGLMNIEGKILNLAPGKESIHWKKIKSIGGEWNSLFDFVRLLYSVAILQEQGIRFSMHMNMNKIMIDAHEKTIEDIGLRE